MQSTSIIGKDPPIVALFVAGENRGFLWVIFGRLTILNGSVKTGKYLDRRPTGVFFELEPLEPLSLRSPLHDRVRGVQRLKLRIMFASNDSLK